MAFRNLCVLVLRMKVASALEGLIDVICIAFLPPVTRSASETIGDEAGRLIVSLLVEGDLFSLGQRTDCSSPDRNQRQQGLQTASAGYNRRSMTA